MSIHVRNLDGDLLQLATELSSKLVPLLDDLTTVLHSFMLSHHLPIISDMTAIYGLEIVRENARKLLADEPNIHEVRRLLDVALAGAVAVNTSAHSKIFDSCESYEFSFKQLTAILKRNTHAHQE